MQSLRIKPHIGTGSAHDYDDHRRYNLDKSPNFPIQARGRTQTCKRPSRALPWVRDAAAHPRGTVGHRQAGPCLPGLSPDWPRRHSGRPAPPISRTEIGTCMPMHATWSLGRRSAAPWAVAAAQRAPRTRHTQVNAPLPLVAVARVCSELQRPLQPARPPQRPPEQRSAAAARRALHGHARMRDVVFKFVRVRRYMDSRLVQCAVSHGRDSEG